MRRGAGATAAWCWAVCGWWMVDKAVKYGHGGTACDGARCPVAHAVSCEGAILCPGSTRKPLHAKPSEHTKTVHDGRAHEPLPCCLSLSTGGLDERPLFWRFDCQRPPSSAWAAAATAAEWMSRASGACGRAAHISRPHAVVAEGTVDAVDASASRRDAQGVRARVIRAVVRGKGMPTV